MSNFADRLQAFKARFAKLGRAGGGGAGGYEDVSALEAPLVGGGASDGGFHHDGGGGYGPPAAARPAGSALYRQTAEVAAPAEEAGPATVHLPSQEEDLAELTALAREASELLWELVATGAPSSGGPEASQAAELAGKARALRAQLRGLISDASESGAATIGEAGLAAGLEAFEMLEASLGEYEGAAGGSGGGGGGGGGEGEGAAAAPPAAAPPATLPPPPTATTPNNPFASGPFAPAAIPAPPPPAAAPATTAAAPSAGPPAPGTRAGADEPSLISFD